MEGRAKRSVAGVGLFLCGLSLVSVVCFGQAAKQRPRPLQPTLSEVLSWLPPDTETILGANGPFPLPDLSKIANDSPQSVQLSIQLELQTRSLPLGLINLKNGGLKEALKGKTVALAIEGSRRFQPPTALGGMRYEGCEVVVLSGALGLEDDAFMKNPTASATRFENFAGITVAVFEESLENDTWTTVIAFPRKNVILIATNMDYLRAVLARMRGPVGERALPQSLREWSYVNTRATAWGVRHYRRDGAENDPTSPFLEQGAANIPDRSAIGTTFSLDPINRTATVNYLSTNSQARQILSGHLGLADSATAFTGEQQVRLLQSAPDVIEGLVPLSGVEVFSRVLLGLLAMMGHAVYL